MSRRKYFLKQFFKEKKTVGAVSPSSRYLKAKMLRDVDFSAARLIVEYGPGTGVFTREIAREMHPECRLLVIELNDSFFQRVSTEFHEHANVIVENRSAEDIVELLEQYELPKADYIISSLPLAVFPKEVTENILFASRQALSPNGKYIQFQYSLTSKRKLHHFFDHIDVSFTARNIPPAFVYTCW